MTTTTGLIIAGNMMSSPRFVVARRLMLHSKQVIYVVRDAIADKTLDGFSYHKRKMEKRADRLNAKVLAKADAYRKAKDNG